LRLFGDLSAGPAHQHRVITETVVFTMLAERGLGPGLCAVFPGGRLEEFITGHVMSQTEMRSQAGSAEIARNVALIHSLEVPVSKEPCWLHDTMRGYHDKLRPIRLEMISERERSCAAALLELDLGSEVDWLLRTVTSLNSPVVFSHNDVNTGNILVRDDNNKHSDNVVLIDFEFSSYNYRGFDIANHFNEWMYNYNRKDYPFYFRNSDKFPTRDQQENFVRNYVATFIEQQTITRENNGMEIGELGSKRNRLSIEKSILQEISVFCLASHLLWTLWSLKQAQTSNIPFAYYSFAKDRMEAYRDLKIQTLAEVSDPSKL